MAGGELSMVKLISTATAWRKTITAGGTSEEEKQTSVTPEQQKMQMAGGELKTEK